MPWEDYLDPQEDLLSQYLGSLSQLAGVDRLQYTDGPERGVELLRFRTGTGFNFDVLPGRGMDIAGAWYQGIPLAWMSSTGIRSASHFEPAGLGWLRSFYGGLVTTCGLTNVGSPGSDPQHDTIYAGIGTEDSEVVKLGLHGRVNNTPARMFGSGMVFEDDHWNLFARGSVTESIVFGEYLELHRQITASPDEASVEIFDTVTNRGFERVPHMMLYHINLGWPVVSPDSELVTCATEVIPRDAIAAPGLAECHTFCEPQPSFPEQVYYHVQKPDEDQQAQAAIINRSLLNGFGVGITYSADTLPELVQWKSMKRGTYVCGLEPANCRVGGRAAEREAGRLKFLEPGESVVYWLVIDVLDGPVECDRFTSRFAR